MGYFFVFLADVLLLLRKVLSGRTFSFKPRFSYTVEKLHCGADRVVVPSGSRQYLSVCRRDFPIQGDVAPKARIGSKTFMRIPSVGSVLFALPTEGILSICHKSFGFLKGIFQNPLKQVRTESATF